MAVNFRYAEIEASHLCSQVIQTIGLFCGSAKLEMVPVYNYSKIIQGGRGSEHQGLPAYSFLQLTVSSHDIDHSLSSLFLQAQGHSHSHA